MDMDEANMYGPYGGSSSQVPLGRESKSLSLNCLCFPIGFCFLGKFVSMLILLRCPHRVISMTGWPGYFPKIAWVFLARGLKLLENVRKRLIFSPCFSSSKQKLWSKGQDFNKAEDGYYAMLILNYSRKFKNKNFACKKGKLNFLVLTWSCKCLTHFLAYVLQNQIYIESILSI